MAILRSTVVVCLATALPAQTPRTGHAKAISLRQMILQAWDLQDRQLQGGPDWLGVDLFEVPAGNKNAVQALLAERFRLVMRTELRETGVYELVVARGGAKLMDSAPGGLPVATSRGGRLTGHNMTMATLTRMLADNVGRTVTDGTGLAGEYEVKLEWTPDAGTRTERERADLTAAVETRSIFWALQEQLGLKLEARRARVPFIIVDRAEKPGEN